MDISEVRQCIDRFRTGESSADELKDALVSGISGTPSLAASVQALLKAYTRNGTLPSALGEELISLMTQRAQEPAGRRSGPVASVSETAPDPSDDDDRTRLSTSSASPPTPSPDPVVPTGPDGDATPPQPAGDTTGGFDIKGLVSTPSEPLTIGSVLKGRYELVAELGRGGMGIVFRALDHANAAFKERQPYVAIKVLGDEFKRHEMAVVALAREARRAMKLAHPNIATVHDFDRWQGNVYMVMELLEGRSLEEIMTTEGPTGLALARVLQFLEQFGAGLSYAHDQGTIHRDVKPSNAFVTNTDVLKVLDFGIARAKQSPDQGNEKTLFDPRELNAMSPPYASLEMLQGQEPDVRDDVYSLACVTYQMLSGRHPFNLKSAGAARDAGLKPERIPSLTRTQWQTLQSGLAFERDRRCATVQQFVDGMRAKPASRAWLIPAVVSVAVLAAAALVAPSQWDALQSRRLASALQTATTDASFDAAYARLVAASPQRRARALQSDEARRALVEHLRARVQALTTPPSYEFAKAVTQLESVTQLMPDSTEIDALRKRLDADAKAARQRQWDLLDAALERSVLVSAQGADDVRTLIARLRSIDPSSRALNDPRLPGAYANAAHAALDQNQTQLAKSLVEAGLSVAAGDPRLQDLNDQIKLAAKREGNQHRAGEIEQRLASLDLAAPDFLERVLAQRDDIETLAAALPASTVVKRVRDGLESLATQRVKQRLAADDIAGAQEFLLNLGELLPENTATALRVSVATASQAIEARTLDTLDRLRRVTVAGPTGGQTGALDLYAELQKEGAALDTLAEARDLVAYGYLREARRARQAADLASATKRLDAAAALNPGTTLRGMIDAERLVLAGRAQHQPPPGAAELAATRERFALALRSPSMGAPELAAFAQALDHLESIGASPAEITANLNQAQDRLLADITRLQKDSSDGARQLAHQGIAALPAAEKLADIYRRLRPAGSGAAPSPAGSPEIAAQREQVAKAIAHPEATERWANELRKPLQRLRALVPATDTLLANAGRVAGETFATAAAKAREQKRYAEAENLLAIARQLVPQSNVLTEEGAAVERDRTAAEAGAANAQLKANIEAVKQRLADQAAAGDIAGSNSTANALRRALSGSVYVANDVPQALITAYARHARAQMLESHVDDALRTLADGRKKFGSSTELKALESHYVVLGDAYDRLSTAVNLNVAEQRRYLDTLRSAEAADFALIERMLARTLANRIADQRAAGRLTIASGLVESGKALFPDQVSVLEHGTAGAIPNTPIEVNPDAQH